MQRINIKAFLIIFVFIGLFLLLIIGYNNRRNIYYLFQSTKQSRQLYAQAKQFQDKRDFKSAYCTYAKISPGYKAYDIVLFQQGKCAVGIEDEQTAVKKFKKILEKFSKSPIAPQASYNLGQAYIRIGNNVEAEKQFEETASKHSKTEFGIGSYYYLGEINKHKNNNLSVKYWSEYLKASPSGRFVEECYRGIKEFSSKLSQNDFYRIAIALFNSKKYTEALEYLNKIPLKLSWYYKAMCYKELGQRKEALNHLIYGLKYHTEILKPPQIEESMLSYVELNDKNIKQSWSEITSWTQAGQDFALYKKAQLETQNDAIPIYKKIVQDYADSSYVSESLWTLFWAQYQKRNFEEAIKLGKQHISIVENAKATPAVHFWMGKIYEKKTDLSKAKNYYYSLMSRFPDSYYAFRAKGRLEAMNTGYDTGWKIDLSNSIPFEKIEINLPFTYQEIYSTHGAQAAELIFAGDYETVLSFIKEDLFLESWINFQQGKISRSIVKARDAMNKTLNKPNKSSPLWKLIYPLYYISEINNYSEIYSLDPFIVLSLLKEESYFNFEAVSSSNARGLMQLLPGTAKDVSRWKNLNPCSLSDLFIPDINIKYGTAYLNYLHNEFNGDMMLTVVSYNGGPGAVKYWLKNYYYSDLDQFIENIPYTESKNYVKKVFGSYWNYKRIYLNG